jgi:hypothetical protein
MSADDIRICVEALGAAKRAWDEDEAEEAKLAAFRVAAEKMYKALDAYMDEHDSKVTPDPDDEEPTCRCSLCLIADATMTQYLKAKE